MALIAVTIENVFGADGRYEIDAEYFTNRELHQIKQISGIRAGELGEAIDAGDSDLLVALAVVALARHGKTVPVDVLWDANAGRIAIEAVIDEAALAEVAALPPESGGDAMSDAAKTNADSGNGSSGSGASPASLPSPTGSLLSETDATYAQPI